MGEDSKSDSTLKPLVLVTGGLGFLGYKTCLFILESGYRVLSVSRKENQQELPEGMRHLSIDITKFEELDKINDELVAVIHVAAITGIWGDKKVYERINVKGTENILSFCRKRNIQNLVYTSSPSVVFDGKDQEMDDESLPYPETYLCDYSRTKAEAERKVLEANSSSLKTVALRPHLIWGKGDPHLIPKLLDSYRKGRLKIIGEGLNKVDMVHVDNAAWAHVDALEMLKTNGEGSGKAYFITNDEPVLMWEWFNNLLKELGEKPMQKKVSEKLAYVVGALCEGVYKLCGKQDDPPMTRFVARQLATHHTYSIAAAKRDLKYHIRRSMSDGVEELINSLKKNG